MFGVRTHFSDINHLEVYRDSGYAANMKNHRLF